MCLWLHAEMVRHMKDGITWQGVDKRLGSSLCVYHAGDVVQVAQDVEAIKHPCQLAFERRIGKTGIP